MGNVRESVCVELRGAEEVGGRCLDLMCWSTYMVVRYGGDVTFVASPWETATPLSGSAR